MMLIHLHLPFILPTATLAYQTVAFGQSTYLSSVLLPHQPPSVLHPLSFPEFVVCATLQQQL